MNWNEIIEDFRNYLQLEKSLSENSTDAYIRDITKFVEFLELHSITLSPQDITLPHFTDFFYWIGKLGISARSQARITSGIKAFYKFLLLDDIIDQDPTSLLEGPKLSKHLPQVLSIEEIDKIIDSIDLSKNEGQRNKAIIETLYSCGLRVSELIDLRISHLYFTEGFIRVIGKGNKERLVPISTKAIDEIDLYIKAYRNHMDIKKGNEDILFLNRRGAKLTRVMIFTIVKNLAVEAQIKKNISPHTFRHSFATHMVDGGADLRAIQEMLGHESIITTEIYTHLDKEHLRDSINLYHPRAHSK